MNFPLSIQLYTLRDMTQKDFAGTVREVAKIGYSAVELAGYGNLKSAGDVEKALSDVRLLVSGAHVPIESLEQNLVAVLDEQQALGNRNIVVPWLDESRRRSADDYRRVGESLNQIGLKCASRGMQLSYHNHSFELQKLDGQFGLDILWHSTDPKLVRAELDVYWLLHGGVDPVAYMNQLGSRVQLLHLKDMAQGSERKMTPLGTGIIDFKSILSAARNLGVEWGVMEQDDCYERAPIDCARESFANLRRIAGSI